MVEPIGAKWRERVASKTSHCVDRSAGERVDTSTVTSSLQRRHSPNSTPSSPLLGSINGYHSASVWTFNFILMIIHSSVLFTDSCADSSRRFNIFFYLKISIFFFLKPFLVGFSRFLFRLFSRLFIIKILEIGLDSSTLSRFCGLMRPFVSFSDVSFPEFLINFRILGDGFDSIGYFSTFFRDSR